MIIHSLHVVFDFLVCLTHYKIFVLIQTFYFKYFKQKGGILDA